MLKIACLCFVGIVFAQTNPPCGVPTVQPKTKRIVGGQVATPGSWPWTVLLVDDYGYISGTGALLNDHVILTSAQHFEGYGYSLYDLDLRYWRVYAGKYNISTTDPLQHYYRVKRVLLHPGYNWTSLANDIALVVLSRPVQFNAVTKPACLPDAAHRYTVGNTCYLPGWGSTRHTGNEEVMNQIAIPIRDDTVCQQHFQGYLPNTEICAGMENSGKDWCVDDLGSPLMCKDQSGAWFVQGIASSGGNCTTADEPSVFEDVSQYSDWIKRQMEDAGFPYPY